MALVVKDRVQETSTTTGTGTLTLSGATTGYQSFSSAIGNTNTTYYAIQGGSEWEVGIGTVSAGALSRDTVLESSNGGSLVDLSAGSKFVFCTYPAERSVSSNGDTSNNEIQSTGSSSGSFKAKGNIYTLTNIQYNGSAATVTDSAYYTLGTTIGGYVTVQTDGTERMRIDSSGNVGIGTSSPSTLLTIGRINSVEEGGQIDLCRSSDNASAWAVDVYGSTSTPSLRFVDNIASATRMAIDGSGNVGIGTSSPEKALSITKDNSGGGIPSALGVHIYNDSGFACIQMNGESSAAGSFIDFSTSGGVDYKGRVIYYNVDNTMAFQTDGSERMRIGSTGVITSTLGGMQVISGTSQASTSGNAITFSSIPSWVKKITLMFVGVSKSSTSPLIIQLGDSGGFETSGYIGSGGYVSASPSATAFTAGFGFNSTSAADVVNGLVTIALVGANTWVAAGNFARSDAAGMFLTAGAKQVSDTLTSVRVTTVAGNQAFDAGTINILYE